MTLSRKGNMAFRSFMITFTVLAILFSSYTFYKHIIIESFVMLFTGLGGLIYFSFRLGKTWYKEDNEKQNYTEVNQQ